ncbi:MAG: very short patch repair endonuclease [Deltaproteobacteria bacterium]|nr:very short patch repair endonuclease [Deltaproteobacteria bacterium]
MSKRPSPSSPQVSLNMKKVRIRDTGPEMAVRRLLYAKGLRYRVNYKPKSPKLGRSTIDIAFPGKRLAIFIDGCFWHNCPEHGEIPKANRKWWGKKFAENAERDEKVSKALIEGGWRVKRFWSHETPENICKLIQETIKDSPNLI